MEPIPAIQPDISPPAQTISNRNGSGESDGGFDAVLSGKLDRDTPAATISEDAGRSTETDELQETGVMLSADEPPQENNHKIPDLDGKLSDNSTAIHTIEIPPLNLSRQQLSIQGMDAPDTQTTPASSAGGIVEKNIDRLLANSNLAAKLQENVRNRQVPESPGNSPLTADVFENDVSLTGASTTSPGLHSLTDETGREMNVIVEKWSAVFSRHRESTASPDSGLKSGEITPRGISSLEPATLEVEPEITTSTGLGEQRFTPAMEADTLSLRQTTTRRSDSLPRGLRYDSTGQYMQSRLPGPTGFNAEPEFSSGGNSDPDRSMDQMFPARSQELTGVVESAADDLATFGSVSSSREAAGAGVDNLSMKTSSGLEVAESRILDQVLDRFSLHQRLESGTVSLKLHPEELGELKLQIHIERDNIKAHIVTENPQVQEILERQIPKLREALAQHGYHLDNMEVTVAAEDNGFHFFQDNSTSPEEQYQSRPGSTTTATFEPCEVEESGDISPVGEGLSVHA